MAGCKEAANTPHNMRPLSQLNPPTSRDKALHSKASQSKAQLETKSNGTRPGQGREFFLSALSAWLQERTKALPQEPKAGMQARNWAQLRAKMLTKKRWTGLMCEGSSAMMLVMPASTSMRDSVS